MKVRSGGLRVGDVVSTPIGDMVVLFRGGGVIVFEVPSLEATLILHETILLGDDFEVIERN